MVERSKQTGEENLVIMIVINSSSALAQAGDNSCAESVKAYRIQRNSFRIAREGNLLCVGPLAAVHAVKEMNAGRSPGVAATNVSDDKLKVGVSALTGREGTRARRVHGAKPMITPFSSQVQEEEEPPFSSFLL